MPPKTWSRGTRYIFTKLCEAVGIAPCMVDFTKDGWYMKHSWSPECSDAFADWLANELYNNAWLRKDAMRYPWRSKQECRKVAMQFVLCYGWKWSQ